MSCGVSAGGVDDAANAAQASPITSEIAASHEIVTARAIAPAARVLLALGSAPGSTRGTAGSAWTRWRAI